MQVNMHPSHALMHTIKLIHAILNMRHHAVFKYKPELFWNNKYMHIIHKYMHVSNTCKNITTCNSKQYILNVCPKIDKKHTNEWRYANDMQICITQHAIDSCTPKNAIYSA